MRCSMRTIDQDNEGVPVQLHEFIETQHSFNNTKSKAKIIKSPLTSTLSFTSPLHLPLITHPPHPHPHLLALKLTNPLSTLIVILAVVYPRNNNNISSLCHHPSPSLSSDPISASALFASSFFLSFFFCCVILELSALRRCRRPTPLLTRIAVQSLLALSTC